MNSITLSTLLLALHVWIRQFRSRAVRRRPILLGGSLVLAVHATSAQPLTPPASTSDVPLLAQAVTLAIKGDVATAEATLVNSVNAPRGTVLWNQLCARQLTRLSLALGSARDVAHRRDVATRALAYLGQAERLTTHAATLSNVRTNAGVLCERCLDDNQSAKEWYRRAIAAFGKSNLAAGALSRLERNDDTDRARRIVKSAGR